MIEELVQRTFAARNAAHLEHWRTKSFSQHSALGEFYDGIIEEIDTLVEAFQGAFDLIDISDLPKQSKQKDIISMLEDDLIWIGKNRKSITKSLQALDNILQSLEGLYLKTIYKLKNLA